MVEDNELGKYPKRIRLIIKWVLSRAPLLETVTKGSITFNFNHDSVIPEIKIVDEKIEDRKDGES